MILILLIVLFSYLLYISNSLFLIRFVHSLSFKTEYDNNDNNDKYLYSSRLDTYNKKGTEREREREQRNNYGDAPKRKVNLLFHVI